MKTKYEKPMMMSVFGTVAEGSACNKGSMANAAVCVTGTGVNVPGGDTNCMPGGTASGASCGTGDVVLACDTGGVPGSTCLTGRGVGH